MKNFTKVIFTICMIALLAIGASAAPAITAVNELDEDTGVYTMTVNAVADPGVKIFSMLFSYNTDVVTLYDIDVLDGAAYDVRETNEFDSVELSENYYRDGEGYVVTADKLSITPTLYQFDTENGRTGMYVALYTDKNTKVVKDGELFTIHFVLADGKTLADAAFMLEGLDTEFDKILGTSPTDPGMATNVFVQDKDGNVYYGIEDEVEFEADFFVTDDEPTKLTIAVAAGDVVYLQDGTVVTIAEANEAYEIPTTDGTVVVNTGYTAQKVYTVADGAVTEDTAKADGVLSTGEASIRDDDTASGIRYKSTFLTSLKSVVSEYGYITTVESAYNALPEGYVLDMALVDSNKAVKDIAYDGETDIFWNVEDDKTVVTAVVTNVPMTEEGVTTNVVIRPYYMVGELVVYGEPMTRTVYEVALNIKTNDAETYAKYQEYIDAVIALVEGSDTDIVIDFGPLFK